MEYSEENIKNITVQKYNDLINKLIDEKMSKIAPNLESKIDEIVDKLITVPISNKKWIHLQTIDSDEYQIIKQKIAGSQYVDIINIDHSVKEYKIPNINSKTKLLIIKSSNDQLTRNSDGSLLSMNSGKIRIDFNEINKFYPNVKRVIYGNDPIYYNIITVDNLYETTELIKN